MIKKNHDLESLVLFFKVISENRIIRSRPSKNKLKPSETFELLSDEQNHNFFIFHKIYLFLKNIF